MPKCALKNCKNITSRTLKKDGISYFRFPRDPIQCGEWISIVSQQRREDFFKPNNSSVVCSEHFFDADMYVTPKGIKRLLKTAVPRVEIEIPDNGGDTEACESKSPKTSLNKYSILDTPRKFLKLKSELQKCRKRLISREKVIDNLRKQNLILIKRNISLENELKVLKKKFKEDSNCQD